MNVTTETLIDPVVGIILSFLTVLAVWFGIPLTVSRQSGLPYWVCFKNMMSYAGGDRKATKRLVEAGRVKKELEEKERGRGDQR